MEETQNVLEGRETIEASSPSTVTTNDEEHWRTQLSMIDRAGFGPGLNGPKIGS